mmetsp:Transcript_46083/g.111627  ORF Transcript_46083/g.111627 Transcript_46083/m.111627 type:complete len:851 (-) Transcript_46083:107-2659(-)
MPSTPRRKAPISGGRPTGAGKTSGSLVRWLLLGFLVLSVSGPFVMHSKSVIITDDHFINEAPRVSTPVARTLEQSSEVPTETIKRPNSEILADPPVADTVLSATPPEMVEQSDAHNDSGDSASDEAATVVSTTPPQEVEQNDADNNSGDSARDDNDEGQQAVADDKDEESMDDESGAKDDEEDSNPTENGTDTLVSASKTGAVPSNLTVTTTLDTWQNDNDIVHILYSRFMQHQPNLLELGKARLELFKTFCLPTISHQTNPQFLWIIRTDPELNPILKDGLLESLQGMENVAVIGSNEVRKGSVDNGFRNKKAIADITPESIFYGNLDLVLSFQEATAGRIVLETNLDADDGLGLTFMETTQSLAKTTFEKIPSKDGWFNFCVGRHLEWQYFAPWDKNTDKGSFELGRTHICVTPGLSWATQPNAVPHFTVMHHMIKKTTPACMESNKPYLGCWMEIPAPRPQDPMAIRARTPTSTGMNGVKVTHEGGWGPRAKALDDESWPLLEPDLAISEALVKSSHKYLKDHLSLLVAENLKGQCTEDHSCGEGIKKKLKSLFFEKGSWINKHDLVHVLHMEVPEKLNLSKLFVGWEPVESQTTYEFLWILYVDPHIDRDSMNSLMKRLRKSPTNVVAFQTDQAPTTSFRDAETLTSLPTRRLLFGEMSLVQSYHEASQNRTLLETSLRANEAITKTFVGDIQNKTFDQLGQFGSSDWYYQCVSLYLEWRHETPRGVPPAHGFASIAKRPSEHCTDRPGTTLITMPEAKIPDGWTKEDSKPCGNEPRTGCYTQSGERNGARALLPGIVDVPIAYQGQGGLERVTQDQPNLREDLHENFAVERYSLREMVKTLNGID